MMRSTLSRDLGRWRASLAGSHSRWHLAIFLCGLAISIVMLTRSQVTIDQYNLLARGWLLASEGKVIAHGVWATGGGQHPGLLTSLLVGLPLLVWKHHQAPVALILLSHLIAYLLLSGTLRRILSPDEQLLFAALYWLSPWRLFYSGFLWNPNFLLIFGALHLVTAYRLRRRPHFWWSFGHVLVLGFAVQVHLSAALLTAASLALWARRYLRLHVGAALGATALVAVSLVPWLQAVIADPARLPVSSVQISDGFSLMPIVQGLMNWLRFAVLSMNRSMACLDLSGVGGPVFDASSGVFLLLRALSVPTTALAIWANWRIWRPARMSGALNHVGADRLWLEGLIRCTFVSALALFAVSPVGVTGHGLLSLLHVAVLPVVLVIGAWTRAGRRRSVLAAAHGFAAVAVALGIAMALGSTAYRCGGPRCGTAHFSAPPLLAEHRMLTELGIRDSCEVAIDARAGWWPDGLEIPAELAPRFPSGRADLETRSYVSEPARTGATGRGGS